MTEVMERDRSSTTRSGPPFFAATWALLRKDIRLETRTRDTLPPMIAFGITVSLLLAFSLPGAGQAPHAIVRTPLGTVPLNDVLSGFFWITVLFAGFISFARTFETERAEGAIDSLLTAALDRSAIFLSKAVANLCYVALVQVVLVPVFLVLWNVNLASGWPVFLLVTLLVDVGFTGIGTLFAALAAQTRSRELMLPILALPVLVPVFIAAVELTASLWAGAGTSAVTSGGWFGILIGFDVVFVTIGFVAFDYAVD